METIQALAKDMENADDKARCDEAYGKRGGSYVQSE